MRYKNFMCYKNSILSFFMLASTLLFSSLSFAQEKNETPLVESIEVQDPVMAEKQRAEKQRAAKLTYQEALKAKQQGQFEKALVLLEQAYAKTRNPLYLFERALVLDAMGEPEMALSVLDENMEVLRNNPDIESLAMTRENISTHVKPIKDSGASDSGEETSLLGPVLTGAGAVLIVIGVVTLFIANGNVGDLNTANAAGKLSRNQYNDKKTSIDTQKIIGATSLLGGTALAGTGLFIWKF